MEYGHEAREVLGRLTAVRGGKDTTLIGVEVHVSLTLPLFQLPEIFLTARTHAVLNKSRSFYLQNAVVTLIFSSTVFLCR